MSRESAVVYIDCPPDPAAIWGGLGNLLLPADAVIPEDDTLFLGGGAMVSLPDFQQLINGTAERIELTLSGIDAVSLALATTLAPIVKNAKLYVGRVGFDEDWQIDGPVEWEAVFRCDVITTDSREGRDGRTRTVTLSVGSDDTGRSRSPNAYFTQSDQNRRSADDNIFDRVASITEGISRRFGIHS